VACSPLHMANHDQFPSADLVSVGNGAFIGPTMRIIGDVFSRDELRVDGEIEGKLESQNRLTVNAGGKANAAIKAAEVVIAGTVNGNVEATQRIVLRKGANLVGDVKTAGIVIEDGAYFRGGIDITRPEVSKAVAG
jgi:cytoskeletal protein CcmA (bactofilin family)